MTTNFYIIGIDENREECFPQGAKEKIRKKKVFSCNAYQYETVKPYLPEKHTWIEIKSPLANVFKTYKPHKQIVIFTSGDPVSLGFTGTIRRTFPLAQIDIHPFFDLIQLLAVKMSASYNEIHTVFFEGKHWHEFDNELTLGTPTIGVFTNRDKTPRAIAERMLRNGYTNYNMSVGEMLGNREYERVRTLTLQDVLMGTFNFPNCIILEQLAPLHQSFDIDKHKLELLNNWNNITTRLPVRLLSISMLDLANRLHFWDIGICKSAIPIDAKLQFPHLQVTTFDIRFGNEPIKERNNTVAAIPGIISIVDNFLEQDIDTLDNPDSVFISGDGGHLPQIIEKVTKKLTPGGIIVFNSVTEESKSTFIEAIRKVNMILEHNSRISIDEHNTVTILKAIQPNRSILFDE